MTVERVLSQCAGEQELSHTNEVEVVAEDVPSLLEVDHTDVTNRRGRNLKRFTTRSTEYP